MEPFLGTIMPVAFNYAPKGWALCNGQTMAIQQYQALFALIGTYFGGNGVTTFMLPDLRGRTPTGMNSTLGTVNGVENVSLQLQQIPLHGHMLTATSAAGISTGKTVPASGLIFAQNTNTAATMYGSQANSVTLSSNNVGMSTGASSPHNNMQPYQVVNYIIALTGFFPSRS